LTKKPTRNDEYLNDILEIPAPVPEVLCTFFEVATDLSIPHDFWNRER